MANDSFDWTRERVIPSDSAACKNVLEEVLAELGRRRWSEHDVFAVHLALEEALVNAIKHGNRYDRDKAVTVQCKVAPKQLWVRIEDQGEGFDPSKVPDPTKEDRLDIPSGRGIMLMRSFMNRVDYNSEGNVVELEKHASGNNAATPKSG